MCICNLVSSVVDARKLELVSLWELNICLDENFPHYSYNGNITHEETFLGTIFHKMPIYMVVKSQVSRKDIYVVNVTGM